MSKYIIELNEDCKIVQQMCVTEHGNAYTDGCYSCNLEELNSDYINEHYGELQDEAYQAGLNDAWEAAQKVVCKKTAGGMSLDTLKEIFGVQSPAAIMQSNTAQQAIDKIKTYEDKHSDRIEVGDEVISDAGTKYTVTSITGKDSAVGFSGRGLWCFNAIDKLKKTGKHYDIASILEAMRE